MAIAYYKVNDPLGRGSLQGGGTARGLGFDFEFLESVLVPQIMLYGFRGFQPRMDGFTLNPRLPSTWPSLTISNIFFHGSIFHISATSNSISIASSGTNLVHQALSHRRPLFFHTPRK